jgi:hypothetical protein
MRILIGILILLNLIAVGYAYLIQKDVLTAVFLLCTAIFLEVLDIEEMIKERNDI